MRSRIAHGGKRPDLDDQYFRSKWEANWARYLNWLIKVGDVGRWEYEGETFEFPVKRGSKYYTTDFHVWYTDGGEQYHEIKGYMDQPSRTKLKRMAKYYPDVEIIVIGRNEYYAVAREMKRWIPEWE